MDSFLFTIPIISFFPMAAISVTIPPHPNEDCTINDYHFPGGANLGGSPSSETSLDDCKQRCNRDHSPSCLVADWVDPVGGGFFASKCWFRTGIGADGVIKPAPGFYVSTPDCSKF